jgi:hypothetical protein
MENTKIIVKSPIKELWKVKIQTLKNSGKLGGY